jgi:glyoxylase-like metal-dependent hydrolase (beta-lactamase superfamily II)
MKEIAPGILLETTIAPYNLVLIRNENSNVVVDIPPDPLDAMNWREKILSQVSHIDFVILTDGSPERQIAAMLWNEPLIVSEAMFRAMAVYDEERARRDLVQRFVEKYPGAGQFVDQLNPRRPMIAFNHRIQLHNRIPPIQLETVDGAAPGSLFVVFSDLDLIIAGDTVCVDAVPPFGHISNSRAWLTTLAILSRRHSIKRIVTGRGSAPVRLGEIDKQREFLRVMRRTARKIARGSPRSGDITEVAQDLGHTFFNDQSQQVVTLIMQGIEKLVEENKIEQAVIQDEFET